MIFFQAMESSLPFPFLLGLFAMVLFDGTDSDESGVAIARRVGI